MIDGMKNASVPVITIAIPHITKTLAMPIASAINPVASNPKMEGNKLICLLYTSDADDEL